MMDQTLLESIRIKIESKLTPSFLNIIDESHLHIGHPGAQSGMFHIRVQITSPCFDGLSKIKQHQLIYAALGSLMQTHIHAVAIEIKPKDA